MATICRVIDIACDADRAWAELRDFGAAARLFAGVLTDCREACGVRTVTFASGRVVQERLISVDDARRRIAYAVLGGSFTQHSASMQLVASAYGVRFIWISDFLPDEVTKNVEPLMNAGCQAIQLTLEKQGAAADP